jgi:hypothetical protein
MACPTAWPCWPSAWPLAIPQQAHAVPRHLQSHLALWPLGRLAQALGPEPLGPEPLGPAPLGPEPLGPEPLGPGWPPMCSTGREGANAVTRQ